MAHLPCPPPWPHYVMWGALEYFMVRQKKVGCDNVNKMAAMHSPCSGFQDQNSAFQG